MMRSLATRSGRVRTGIFGLAATVALAAACSSEPPIPGADGEQGEGGEGGFTLVGSGSAEPCNGGAACAEITATAEVVPLTVYILFDKSVSMLDDGKWEAATQALTQFFESKQAARLRIALKFFPGTNPCQSSFYKVPDVALGTLTDGSALDDTHEQALIDAVEGASASGVSTPIYAALAGAYAWGEDQLEADEKQQVAVVLVTDGDPDACAQDTMEGITAAAADAAALGTVTYVIGLQGSNQANLDSLAAAGGTNEAFVVGTTSLTSELADALSTIRVSELACQFDLPSGDNVEPTLVNACFTPEGGGESTLEKIDGPASCSNGKQWYYDDASLPTQIILCPSTCESVQTDNGGQMEIVFGCPTEVPR